MSMFGDYKSYKKYAPQYPEWKATRDLAEAKREAYLRKNPNEINPDDIQKSKALLRAIDVMDEYSQKRAEDMEAMTETVVSTGLELAATMGMGLGFLLTRVPTINNLIKKHAKNDKKLAMTMAMVSTFIGGVVGTISAFPLFAWASKAEVKASRKGRFEAMRTELNDPKTFAVLTFEQEKLLNQVASEDKKEKKSPFQSFSKSWNGIKEMLTETKAYKTQKKMFDERLAEDNKYIDKELTAEEIENAKKDQQLLTKLVEKIDIASQDYAENAELATSAFVTTIFALSALFTLGYEKLAKVCKFKSSNVPAGIGMLAMVGGSLWSASIQKQASRVGRFKVKQELIQNPEQLVYVSDEKTGEISDIEIKPQKKQGFFRFLKNAWKNNQEFEKWKKNEGAKEKRLAKAMENIELSEEQMKDAKRLQHNTFKTFNKIDENSQRYSESIEALGQALQYPIGLICSTVGVIFGIKHLTKSVKGSDAEFIKGMMKYISTIILSTLPSIGFNAYITKEQKKASRVADMLAINELSDYKNFADYSRFKVQ